MTELKFDDILEETFLKTKKCKYRMEEPWPDISSSSYLTAETSLLQVHQQACPPPGSRPRRGDRPAVGGSHLHHEVTESVLGLGPHPPSPRTSEGQQKEESVPRIQGGATSTAGLLPIPFLLSGFYGKPAKLLAVLKRPRAAEEGGGTGADDPGTRCPPQPPTRAGQSC